MKLFTIFAGALLALIPVSVAAETVCSRATFAGQWRASDAYGICDLTVNRQGRIRGTCGESEFNSMTGEEEYVEFAVGGTAFIEPDCSVRVRLTAGGEAYTLFGRIWGTASSTPDAGIISTRRGPDQFAFSLYRP